MSADDVYTGGGVPLNMTTIGNKLQSVGYSTHQIGKWHCGMSGLDRLPVSRGFNSSFGYLRCVDMVPVRRYALIKTDLIFLSYGSFDLVTNALSVKWS